MSDDIALVIGATGYTGRAVVAELCARGIETWAHIRPDSTSLDTLRAEFEACGAHVDITPWEKDAIHARVAALRPTLVFGLLGITAAGAKREARRRGSAPPTYMSVDYGLTAMTIDACVAAGIRPRFVYLSSMGVREEARGAYIRARVEAERHLRESGLPYTVARPSFITGGRDEARPAEAIGAAVSDAALDVLGALGARRLRRRYRSRTNDELATALVDAALDPACEGRVLESEELGEN
jgi:nucleoside-diphosphate-sugar epimerase